MVEIQAVSKTFQKTVKHGTSKVKALADVNLSVRENEFISIIGPSGCGKTTLLKLIDDLLPYDSGNILISGKQVTAPGPDRAVVFQSFALLPWRTVLANVEYSLELRQMPKEDRTKIAYHYLQRVGLADFEHHYPHELSGGMQQRAGLARALAVNPSILLMDEPFGAVDAQTRQLLQEELLELWQRERKTVIFITHSMDEAVYLSDRLFGLPLGLLMGRYRWLQSLLDIYMTALLTIPMISFIPFLVIAFGLGLPSRVWIVFLFAFVIIVINTSSGVRNVDPTLTEMARSFGARESELFLKVILPAALPMIMAGVRLGMGRAVLGMVTSELILTVVGFGAMLMTFGASFNSPALFATLLTIVLIAVGLLALIQYLDRRLTPWRAAA